MPSNDAPPPPQAPAAPLPPNIGDTIREGTQAQIDTLPLRYQAQAEWQDKFQNLSLEGEAKSADARAASALDIIKRYGNQFAEAGTSMNEAADPVGTALRKELGERVLSNLKLDTTLDPALEQQIRQSYRAARSVRGGGFGDEEAVLEAMTLGDAGLRLQNQRFADAEAFLAGRAPATLTAPNSPTAPGPVVDPNTPTFATQFAESIYGDKLRFGENAYNNQVSIWNTQLTHPEKNPWMAALSGAMSGAAAGSAAGPYGALGGAVIGGGLGYAQAA